MAQQPRQKSEYETFKSENMSNICDALRKEGSEVNRTTIAAKAKEMFADRMKPPAVDIMERLAHHVSVLLRFEASVKASARTYDTETEEYIQGDPYDYTVDWATVSCALKMLLFPDKEQHNKALSTRMTSVSDEDLNDRKRELLASFRDRLENYIAGVTIDDEVGHGLSILLDDMLAA